MTRRERRRGRIEKRNLRVGHIKRPGGIVHIGSIQAVGLE